MASRQGRTDLVITCAGATVHTSYGYRDMFLRLQPEGERAVAAGRRRSGW